jgi:hypothetical protein
MSTKSSNRNDSENQGRLIDRSKQSGGSVHKDIRFDGHTPPENDDSDDSSGGDD